MRFKARYNMPAATMRFKACCAMSAAVASMELCKVSRADRSCAWQGRCVCEQFQFAEWEAGI